jgi:hypothetical protein
MLMHYRLTWESFDHLLPDDDLINVSIVPNALGVAADAVEFRLENASHLVGWKAIRVPDGEPHGSAWEIWVEGNHRADSVALWAHQVNNGQSLEFKKAKLFGVHTGMYDLGGLERLPGGSRVIFRWVRDAAEELRAWVEAFSLDLPRVDGRYQALTGQSFGAHLTMRNFTEVLPWNADTRIKLASDTPRDNTLWGLNRVDLPREVTFWQTVTFDFVATAPQTPGDYPFHWGLLEEGVERFGQRVIPTIAVRAAPPPPPPPPSTSGETVIELVQQPTSWFTYNGQSGDPSVSSQYPTPRHAVIAWLRNDSDATFYLIHEDRLGAQSALVPVGPRATLTAPFAQLDVEGVWQAQYRGAQSDAPANLHLTVAWRAP